MSFTGHIAGEHDSSAEFAESASEAEHEPRQNAVHGVRDNNMQKNFPVICAESFCGEDDIFIDEFKGGACGAIHEW